MTAQHDFMAQFTQQTIYLMGMCFILGSLFTIFILLILDMVRRNSFIAPPSGAADEQEQARSGDE